MVAQPKAAIAEDDLIPQAKIKYDESIVDQIFGVNPNSSNDNGENLGTSIPAEQINQELQNEELAPIERKEDTDVNKVQMP